ncbi:hypothetical protein [Streptomyces sp. BE303]|uniref:hypothetical protein n=1 Tax=Streptomyces sp. BE303 TaxID=3002528 RepID=UPI002E762F40|nr:hypothetical protein [Streptomyces sp. BE303]MED7951538.1 hypothetical protein [Streptomyces sp. BE303]
MTDTRHTHRAPALPAEPPTAVPDVPPTHAAPPAAPGTAPDGRARLAVAQTPVHLPHDAADHTPGRAPEQVPGGTPAGPDRPAAGAAPAEHVRPAHDRPAHGAAPAHDVAARSTDAAAAPAGAMTKADPGPQAGAHTATHAGAHGAARPTPGGWLDRQRVEVIAAEWGAVQAGFVDDPAGAVTRADDLIGRTADQVAEAVAQRRAALRPMVDAAAKGSGGSGTGAGSTEELRLAMRDFRSVLDRLIAS